MPLMYIAAIHCLLAFACRDFVAERPRLLSETWLDKAMAPRLLLYLPRPVKVISHNPVLVQRLAIARAVNRRKLAPFGKFGLVCEYLCW